MSTITGELSGTDYGDNTVHGLTPGAYTYTLEPAERVRGYTR